jgi:hypothetical protein
LEALRPSDRSSQEPFPPPTELEATSTPN